MTTERGRRPGGAAARAFAWAAPLILMVASWFNGQEVIVEEPVGLTAWLLGAGAATTVGLALLAWLPGRAQLWRATWPGLLAFGLLLAWALVRTLGFATCIATRDGEPWPACYPTWVAWVPIVQAAVTMLLAWLLVAATRAGRREGWLVCLALTIVGMGMVGLVRALLDPRGFNRLGTGLGGAAVLSCALVLAVVVLVLAGVRSSGRARWLLVAATMGVALTVLTFSRAGLALLVLTAVALLALGGRRLSGRALLAIAGAVGALSVGAVTVFPELAGRLLTLGDPGRATNLATAVQHWWSSPGRVLFGAGNGAVWPWFGVDANLIWAPETGELTVEGIGGSLLVNPHSLFLGVLVELGVVGFVALLGLVWFVLRVAVREVRLGRAGVGLASAVCVVAFVFDTYLLRNPGVSFVWWLAVFAAASECEARRKSGKPAVDSAPAVCEGENCG